MCDTPLVFYSIINSIIIIIIIIIANTTLP